jgi:hypothetical protein
LNSPPRLRPPDVRRGVAPPSTLPFRMGCALRSGLARTTGTAPKVLRILDGEAEPRLTSGGEAGVAGVRFKSALDFKDDISQP